MGILAYLYAPFDIESPGSLNSQSVESPEEIVSAEVIVLEKVPDDFVSGRRIRLTNLLLRYQKEKAQLESQTDTPSESHQAEIDSLRQKIANLGAMITELSQ